MIATATTNIIESENNKCIYELTKEFHIMRFKWRHGQHLMCHCCGELNTFIHHTQLKDEDCQTFALIFSTILSSISINLTC